MQNKIQFLNKIEEDHQKLMIMNDNIKKVRQKKDLEIEEEEKSLIDKYNKINYFKERQNLKYERKMQIKNEFLKRKKELEEELSILCKKDIDDKMILKIHQMFPN